MVVDTVFTMGICQMENGIAARTATSMGLVMNFFRNSQGPVFFFWSPVAVSTSTAQMLYSGTRTTSTCAPTESALLPMMLSASARPM